MNWIHRAEQKFGFLGIPGLAVYLVGLNFLVFALCKMNPAYLEFVRFDSALIMQGQVWRLVTFLFIPNFSEFLILPGWLMCALYLMWLYYVTSALEHAMGPFRLTLYLALGCVALLVACFVVGQAASLASALITTSIFLAFARFYPDAMIYLMFILPVKVKWMAWVTVALLLLNFVGGSAATRIATIAGLLNYLVFFGSDIFQGAKHRQETARRRAKFERDVREGTEETLHRCAVCQRTELTSPDLEFRVAKDGQEYCTEHLPKAPAAAPQA